MFQAFIVQTFASCADVGQWRLSNGFSNCFCQARPHWYQHWPKPRRKREREVWVPIFQLCDSMFKVKRTGNLHNELENQKPEPLEVECDLEQCQQKKTFSTPKLFRRKLRLTLKVCRKPFAKPGQTALCTSLCFRCVVLSSTSGFVSSTGIFFEEGQVRKNQTRAKAGLHNRPACFFFF